MNKFKVVRVDVHTGHREVVKEFNNILAASAYIDELQFIANNEHNATPSYLCNYKIDCFYSVKEDE